MRKAILISLLTSLLIALTAHAQWMKVDDFEGGNLDNWELTTNFPDLSDTFLIAEDPAGPGNNVLIVSPGVNPDKRVVPQIELPMAINEGETATFYFRFYSFGLARNVNWGLSDVPEGEPVDFWSDFETQLYANEAGIGYRNGGNFVDSGNLYSQETWYEVWLVVRNLDGIETDTFDIYVRGGTEYDEPTLITGEIFFRNGTIDPIRVFAMLHYYGSAGTPDGADPVAYDDLWITSGVAVETPGEDPGPSVFLPGAVELGENWEQQTPFGTYNVTFAPWIFHNEHNFLWMGLVEEAEFNPNQLYFWHDDLESWIFTGIDPQSPVYPDIYVFALGTWGGYSFVDGERRFLRYDNGETVVF